MTNSEIWLKLIAEGKFSVTQNGEIINQVTKKKLANRPSKNPLVSWLYEGKIWTLTKGKAAWLGLYGAIADDCIVTFKDENANNTHPNNLICRTRSEQVKQQFAAGKMKPIDPKAYLLVKNFNTRGSRKLTEDLVIILRQTIKAGHKISFETLMKNYKVNRETIRNAIRGVSFKDLKETPIPNYLIGTKRPNFNKNKISAKPKLKRNTTPISLPVSATIETPKYKYLAEKFIEYRRAKSGELNEN